MPVSQPVLINSDFKLLDPFECGDDVGTLSNEPMFFNASLDFAYDKGGEITRSPTIFAKGMCTMPAVADEVNVYGEWNKEVYALLAAQELLPVEAPNKQLIEFNWQSFHTAQQAKEAGWRWFGRASMNTERTGRITNQMRNQTQVYLEAPEAGW